MSKFGHFIIITCFVVQVLLRRNICTPGFGLNPQPKILKMVMTEFLGEYVPF